MTFSWISTEREKQNRFTRQPLNASSEGQVITLDALCEKFYQSDVSPSAPL